MWIRVAVILLMIFAQAGFFSNAEAKGDEAYHRDILRALKKINSRLILLENDKLKAIQSVQENVLRQIEEIKDSLQQIQATGEINKSEMLASTEEIKTKLLDVEGHLGKEIMHEFDKQNQEGKNYKDQFLPLLVQLEKSLSDQNKALDNTHTLLKVDLIPALKNENEKMRQIIVAEIAKQIRQGG